MVEYKSHKTVNIYPSLNDENPSLSKFKWQFRFNRISEFRDYFAGEIKKRELMSNCLVNILLLLTILVSN